MFIVLGIYILLYLPENWTSQILALEYSMKRHWNYAHHSILFIYAGWWSSKYASRTYYLEDCYKSCCDLYLCNGQHPHLDRNIVIFSKKFMKQSRVISPSFFCSDLGYPKQLICFNEGKHCILNNGYNIMQYFSILFYWVMI